MRTKQLGLWLCILVLSGCMLQQGSREKSVEGSWQLYDITLKDETDLSFSSAVDLKSSVKEGSVLSFFADNSYSEMDGPGNFKAGEWSAKGGDAIELIGPEARIKNAIVTEEKNGAGKSYYSLQVEKGGLVLKYRKIAAPLKHYEDDPFYAANNQWRTKPVKPENTKELTQRLAGYIKHLALVLKAAKERKQDIVSFEFSKGPVKIYNGGIGIYPYGMVPAEWKKSFHNDSSALAAYGLYENYLRTTSYKGAAIGDWVEDDYNILLSTYADFTK
ncbi:MAG TPA: hypothetical protein VGN63_15400 [Flavisolibacter sp.]|nr:hypothetical protein [Flavisolibacter sp.]